MTATNRDAKPVVLPLDALADALGAESENLLGTLIVAHTRGLVRLPIDAGVSCVELAAGMAERIGLKCDGQGHWWTERPDPRAAEEAVRKPRIFLRDFAAFAPTDRHQRPVWEIASEAERPEARPLPTPPADWPARTSPTPGRGMPPGPSPSPRPEERTHPSRAGSARRLPVRNGIRAALDALHRLPDPRTGDR